MKSQEKISRHWFYFYPLLLALLYSQDGLFGANQTTKFISGLASAGYGDIASDWMARITDPFPLFSHLLKWQYQLIGLYASVHLFFILLVALYAVAGCWLANQLLSAEPKAARQRALIVFSLSWMFLHAACIRVELRNIIPPGLASQYVLGDYYQPCCFGVLLLIGIAAYVARSMWLALICFAAVPLFHPAYLLGSGLLAAIMVTVPANRELGIDWRTRLLFFLPLALVLVPFGIWNAHVLSAGDPAIRERAYRLLAETRIPGHALPAKWNLYTTIAFFVVGIAATWIARRQFLGQLLGVSLIVTAANILWIVIAFDPTIAVVAPWRVSVFLAPLSWIILLSALAHRLVISGCANWIFRGENIRTSILVTVLLSAIAGTVGLAADYYEKKNRPYYGVSHYIKEHHQAGDQYLIPPEEMFIRLEAQAPVYVSQKSHPTKDTEFLAWHERLVAARTVYAGPPRMAAAMLQLLRAHEGVTHIVWPKKRDFPFGRFGGPLFQDDYFSLWDVRAN